MQLKELKKDDGDDDFTLKCSIVVVANALLYAADPIGRAQDLLGRRDSLKPGQQSTALNGHLFVATGLLLSVLDGIATACHTLARLPSHTDSDMHFKNYPFDLCPKHSWVDSHRQEILELQFEGKNFFDQADKILHKHAWVGSVSSREPIADVCDVNGAGFVYDFLVRIHKKAQEMICALGKQYKVQVPEYPKL